MSTPNDGGQAFPTGQKHEGQFGDWMEPGMSLRDYFASAALQGQLAQLANPATIEQFNALCKSLKVDQGQAIAVTCYKYADAMLAARVKEGER